MRRPGARTKRPVPSRIAADPSLLDLDLIAWAGERTARGGRQDALLGRVETLRLSIDGRTLEARVRGNRPLPYLVSIRAGSEGPRGRCTCSRDASRPCRHAVAVLEALRFPVGGRPAPRRGRRGSPGRVAGGRGRIIQHAPAKPGFFIVGEQERTCTRDERIAAAREEELTARRTRARGERARVDEQIADDGLPRYVVTPRNGQPPERVTLRGVDEGRLACTCDDFAGNELQTCKHVERVRNWRRRQRKRDRALVAEGVLSMSWYPRVWTESVPEPLAEIRVDGPAPLPVALTRYFDEEGWLRPPPATRDAAAWARAAREAARRTARRRGWSWSLDPAVTQRVRRAAAERRLAARLRTEPDARAIWDDVIGRVHFDLHPYQQDGAKFLARRGRAFLADDMGLGKTVQAIVATLILRRTVQAGKALVVCPASLKHQWSREIQRACDEQAVVVEGPRAERLATYRRWTGGFMILNYELVLRDLEAIRAVRADLVILDEAQRIKNWSTKTARAVKRLDSPYAFVLTGTPLENRLLELHSLVEFLHRRAAGPRWRLLPYHAVTEEGGRVVAYEGLDALRQRLSGMFLRRERGEVQDQLPERTDNTFWTGMTPAQRLPYRRHAATAAALIAEKRPLTPPEVRSMLRALTAMRMLCNAQVQYAWDVGQALIRETPPASRAEVRRLASPKLEEFFSVIEDLLDESEEKVVVFSQWERMLRLAHFTVRGLLEQRDLRADVFHGGLSGRARAEMLEAFRTDPEFRVMFSTDAGGLGLNLQEAASIVVNLEVPWNPAVLEQRVGRVHRMGQQRSVQVLHFVTRGAIEERVRQVVESKRALFEGLLVDGADEVVLDEGARSSLLDRARTLIGDEDA